MKTIKPIATISYNSFGYLKGTLERLVANGFISFYAFIKHTKEDDEEKDHYHVYIEPAQRVDTIALQKTFDELTPSSPAPLKVLPFRTSKWVDWYWYGIHDKTYLMAHGMQARKYHYTMSQISTSSKELLEELVRCNPNPSENAVYNQIEAMIETGLTPYQIAKNLGTPLSRLAYVIAGIDFISRCTLSRANKSHTPALPDDGSDKPNIE